MQNPALATLLIVEDEIEGEARPAGPPRIRRLIGIPNEIARIAGHRGRAAVMPMSLSRGAIVMHRQLRAQGKNFPGFSESFAPRVKPDFVLWHDPTQRRRAKPACLDCAGRHRQPREKAQVPRSFA
jgi:hypothetical protein